METSAVFLFFRHFWFLWAEMAPYLLFGFAVAGLMSVILRPQWVERHLGNGGVWQIVKATFVGVPMPLCSCSVIPVAASLRSAGASKGATGAFLASTPQTGVDSFFVTYAMLGPVVTLVKIVNAFVSGVLIGLGIELVEKTEGDSSKGSCGNAGSSCCCHSDEEAPEPTANDQASCCATSNRKTPVWRKVIEYGFVTIPRDLGRSLTVGIFLAVLVGFLVPAGGLDAYLPYPWIGYIAVTLLGVPLYVCSTGSIPLALALIAAGASPGAAMVFLITGPATNIVTVSSLFKMMGARSVVVYILLIVTTAWLAGAAIDIVWHDLALDGAVGGHEPHLGFASHVSGLAMVILFVNAMRKPKPAKSK